MSEPATANGATKKWRIAAAVLGYVVLYLALDWLSLIDPTSPLGIVPWNPPVGLSFALLLRFGARFAPAVFAAVLAAELLLHNLVAAPVTAVAVAFVVALCYGAAAAFLARSLRVSLRLDDRRDLLALFGVALAATGVVALAVVAIYCATGLLPWRDFGAHAWRFWVGDVIGIAVFTPFLLLLPDMRRLAAFLGTRTALEYGLQFAAIGLGLWIIFGLEPVDHFEFSYVLFLPLIWIGLRDGLVGAAWGVLVTQLGLVAAIQIKGFDADTVTQFQVLMLAVAVTGIVLGATVDERQRAEDNLRDSETRLQTVVATAPDAILTFEASGAITSSNRAASEMFGGGQRALTERRIDALLPGLPLPEGGSAAGREIMARRLDGAAFAAEAAIGKAEVGGRPLFVAVVRDATARKQAEALLKQHEVHLAHAQRVAATGEMAAALAHEINQPLTAMIGLARACEAVLQAPDAEAGPVRGQAADLIAGAVQQALRAGEIVRRARDIIGRADSRRVCTEVPALVARTLDLVRTEALHNRVEIATRLEAALPAVFVDPIRIEQVLLNLVRNAIEEIAGADAGRREIAIAARRAPVDADFVEISVADTGPGFAPEIRDRLFRPFATTKPTGMGIGLSLCRSIIEELGGRIGVAPTESGAEIRFTLPVYADAAES